MYSGYFRTRKPASTASSASSETLSEWVPSRVDTSAQPDAIPTSTAPGELPAPGVFRFSTSEGVPPAQAFPLGGYDEPPAYVEINPWDFVAPDGPTTSGVLRSEAQAELPEPGQLPTQAQDQSPPPDFYLPQATDDTPIPSFFDPIFVPPYPIYQALIPFSSPDPMPPFSIPSLEPPVRTLPAVHPRPLRFYRVQHSAAHNRRGKEILPASRTQDIPAFGLNASTIFPLGYERRINKTNIERVLDPMNVLPTSLVALYSNYGESASPGLLCVRGGG